MITNRARMIGTLIKICEDSARNIPEMFQFLGTQYPDKQDTESLREVAETATTHPDKFGVDCNSGKRSNCRLAIRKYRDIGKDNTVNREKCISRCFQIIHRYL